MEELCQLIIYKSDKSTQYLGKIFGLKKQIFSFNPDDILSGIYIDNNFFKVYQDSKVCNLLDCFKFSRDEQKQYSEILKGLKYLIDECCYTGQPLSLYDLELLKPYYEVHHIFTPISKDNTPNATYVSPPIDFSTFDIKEVLKYKTTIYHDFFYQCFSPSDIIFSLLHFQALTYMKYGICKHCQRVYATRNLRNTYCNNNSQYPGFEKYSCYEAKKEILRKLTNTRRKIHNNLLVNDTKDKADYFRDTSSVILKEAKKNPTYDNFDKCFEIIDVEKWRKKDAFRNTVKHCLADKLSNDSQ